MSASSPMIEAYNAQRIADLRAEVAAKTSALARAAGESDRAELRAGGVPEATVLALYPYTTGELMRGVYVSSRFAFTFAHLDGNEQYEFLEDSLTEFRFSLPDDVYEGMEEALEQYMREEPLFSKLFERIKRSLSGANPEHRTISMTSSLWYSCYLIEHGAKLPVAEDVIDGVVRMVLNWIFPELGREAA